MIKKIEGFINKRGEWLSICAFWDVFHVSLRISRRIFTRHISLKTLSNSINWDLVEDHNLWLHLDPIILTKSEVQIRQLFKNCLFMDKSNQNSSGYWQGHADRRDFDGENFTPFLFDVVSLEHGYYIFWLTTI